MSQIVEFSHPIKTDEYCLHSVSAGTNLKDWLALNLPNSNYSATCNFAELSDLDYIIKDDDVVSIRPTMGLGVDWLVWASIALSVASTVYSLSMMPDEAATQNESQQASSVYNYNSQGNQPKLGNPVPVQFGRMPHYPDIITPSWLEYVNNEQYYYQVFSKGIGKFDIHGHYIGETSLDEYEADVEVRVHEPGEAITHFPSVVWTSDEVGSSDGRSGLALQGKIVNVNVWVNGDGYFCYDGPKHIVQFNNSTNDTTGYRFPWRKNENVMIRTATIVLWAGSVTYANGGDNADTLYSAAGWGSISAGRDLLIVSSGQNGGRYTVLSKSSDGKTVTLRGDLNGDAVTTFTPGTFNLTIYAANVNDGIYVVDTDYYGHVSQIRAETMQKISTWTGFTRQTVYTTITTYNPDGEATWVGDYASCPESSESEDIGIDIVFPQGIRNSDGGDLTVQFEIRAKKVGTSSYITHTVSVTDSTTTPQRFTYWLKDLMGLTKGRWLVGCKKLTNESSSSAVLDEIEWTGLKSIIERDYSNEEETIITLKIRATNALSQSANQKYWCDSTRIIPVRQSNGSYIEQPTTSISDALIDACRNNIYGAGLSDDAIDFDTILAYREKWKTRGDECNGLFDQPTAFWDAITSILQTGRAYPRIDLGVISLWRDEPRTALCKPYSPVNMQPNSFSADIALAEDGEYDGIEVEWFNPSTRKSETLLCNMPLQDGLNPKQLKLNFVTNEEQAQREGLFHAAVQAYRRTSISFTTDLDGWDSNYGDMIPVSHDAMQWGNSGQVLEMSGQYLQLSGLTDWQSGQHYIVFNDGNSIHGPYRISRSLAADDIVLLLDKPTKPIYSLGEKGQQPSHYMLGVANKIYRQCILMKVKQSDEFAVTCEAIEDDVRIDKYT